MVSEDICVYAVLACFIFVLLIVYLLKNVSVGGPVPKTFNEAYRAFRNAKNWPERLFVIFLCTPVFFADSYKLVMTIISILAFVCVVAVCGSAANLGFVGSVVEILRQVYRIFSPS